MTRQTNVAVALCSVSAFVSGGGGEERSGRPKFNFGAKAGGPGDRHCIYEEAGLACLL